MSRVPRRDPALHRLRERRCLPRRLLREREREDEGRNGPEQADDPRHPPKPGQPIPCRG